MEKLNTQKVRDFAQSKKSALITTAIAVSTALSSYTAFAANDLTSALQSVASNLYTFLLNIANPLALVAGALCLITLFFNRNPQKKDMSYDWLKTIIIAFIALNLLGLIISQIQGFTSNLGGSKVPW